MKNTITKMLAIALSLTGTVAVAQTVNYPYEFAASNQPYVYLPETATEILGSTGWDDDVVPFTLPITFDYIGVANTDWKLDTYGGLYPNELNIDVDIPYITGIYSDYIDNGNSMVRYVVEGTAGSRIAKIEFRNLGIFDGAATDSVNFQIWLHEGTDKIEYHVGPSNVNPMLLGFENADMPLIVGLAYGDAISTELVFHAIKPQNNVQTDTLVDFDVTTSDEDALILIDYGMNYPTNTSVFSFTPLSEDTSTSVRNIPSAVSGLYPNPTTNNITLLLKQNPTKGALVRMYDVTGKLLQTQQVTETKTVIDMQRLAKGVYTINYSSTEKQESFRVIKK